jgi:ethanolamine utilization protein EutP (predicted NTPase)
MFPMPTLYSAIITTAVETKMIITPQSFKTNEGAK